MDIQQMADALLSSPVNSLPDIEDLPPEKLVYDKSSDESTQMKCDNPDAAFANLPNALTFEFVQSRSGQPRRFPLPGIGCVPVMTVSALTRDNIPFELQFFDALGRCPKNPSHDQSEAITYLDGICPNHMGDVTNLLFDGAGGKPPIAWLIAPLSQTAYDSAIQAALRLEDDNVRERVIGLRPIPGDELEVLTYFERQRVLDPPAWNWNLTDDEEDLVFKNGR